MSRAPTQSDRLRLFFGLWPDDAARTTLANLARDAQAECGGRAVNRDKIHLTLFFLGDVERARVSALKKIAALVHTRGLDFDLDTLGYWRHNRIVWAGASYVPAALAALERDLREALAREGVPGEERPYVPHVTLLRNARCAPGRARFPPCSWRAREFVLIESVPTGGGVRYDVRARWPL